MTQLLIHKAAFGEKLRRHDFLAVSLDLEPAMTGLSGITALTDRPTSDPPAGEALTAYLSGFPYHEWYVLARTFPAPDSPRGGMVRSLCLLMPLQKIGDVHDLAALVTLLPAASAAPHEWEAWKADVPSTFELEQNVPTGERKASLDPGLLGLTATLLKGVRPTVWAGPQDTFEQALAALWTGLPPALRRQLRFGHGHAPSDFSVETPHLVSTPASAAPRWGDRIAHPIPLEAASRAARYLAGDPDAAALGVFLAELPDLPDFTRHDLADTCLNLLDALEADLTADALPAARLLKQLAPAPDVLAARKTHLVEALTGQLRRGDAPEALRFANFPADAFLEAHVRLSDALRRWFREHIGEGSTANVVFRALEGEVVPWWRDAVTHVVEQVARAGDTPAAQQLWAWWTARPDLFEAFVPWLAPRADATLFEAMPPTLGMTLAQRAVDLLPADFVRLTAASLVALHGPRDALNLALTDSPNPAQALHAMRVRLGNEPFVLAAVKLGRDEALIEAGAAIAAEPRLLMHLDPGDAAWRTAWAEAVRLGVPPLPAAHEPGMVVAGVLDAVLEGELVPTDLLAALAVTPHASLLGYSRRAQAWRSLPDAAQRAFLTATARALLGSGEGDGLIGIEDELARAALDPSLLTQVLRDDSTRQVDILSAYARLLVAKGRNELQAITLVTEVRNRRVTLPILVVEVFAAHLCSHDLQAVAQGALDTLAAHHSPTLAAIVERTYSLLPLLPRLRAKRLLRKSLDEGEFHAALVAALAPKFPRGPHAEGVWEDAGGDSSQIELQGSADAMWRSALRQVKAGRVSLYALLRVALDRYPNDPEFFELERLSHLVRK